MEGGREGRGEKVEGERKGGGEKVEGGERERDLINNTI